MLFLRLHIPDRLKNTKLTELNVVDVQRSINAVKQSRTRVDVFNFYHGSLATAYKLKLTPYNLADMLVKPKHERNVGSAPNQRELTEFLTRMPAKNKTNLAKTPPFSRFLSNSRLKYVWYVCTRLYQKSSKISTFWLLASLTADF